MSEISVLTAEEESVVLVGEISEENWWMTEVK